MILDLATGAVLAIDGLRYTVVENATFHDVDFRLDSVRLSGPTPAHERWLVALLPEPYLLLLHKLGQDWLGAPHTSFVHDGETFIAIHQGSAFQQRRGGRPREGRVDYALFRANSGQVILTLAHNDELNVWAGITIPKEAVSLDK